MIEVSLIEKLRRDVECAEMSEKRRAHTLAVEKMAVRIGEIYAPDKLGVLSAAALLHDITKEYSTERQIEICRAHGYEPRDIDIFAPKTFHARTAAMLIPELYPELADSEVVSAVRWHTTGRAGMTLIEKLIFLADYIDDSRSFEDCVALRRMFFDADLQNMTERERLSHLDAVLTAAYRMTISALVSESSCINPDTLEAYNELVCRSNKN